MNMDKNITAQIKLSKEEFAALITLNKEVIASRETKTKYKGLESNVISRATAGIEIKVEHVKGNLNVSGSGKINETDQEILEFYNGKIEEIEKKLKSQSDKLITLVKKHCQKAKQQFTGNFEIVEPSFLHILK